ncbi:MULTISPECIES: hypothetical protein [Photobacterium]|uniref:Lipoprotein n=2 Tax=Photobacterium angustum TaxID=661 RepID=Q1ZQE7_PHOAS|nr:MULTISPECIES: hypothetical protein [Photobacterium]EAS64350.1 hypothetical protein VAS14_01491 [Photobacterium angustum S14]PQJ67139.1 hypothetical protein BTO08_06865 [Photobacterium angustum]PSV27269.1 hypothetical protein C9J42_06395 [Photobacterium sp. GB-56]PSV36366.1 hypothetical protein C9J44_10445 [Photobacterium sp. GB-27]PSV41038.1 hypothetical protein C9J38_03100 [Photobacterium sp. GB-210]
MKKQVLFSLIAFGLVGCAGTPSNSYTLKNAAGVSSWELCKNIGYHEFFNRTEKAAELKQYVTERGDIAPESCAAAAQKGKEFAEQEYHRNTGL